MPTLSAPDVSILVVAFNSGAVIGPCLRSIPLACARHSFEVLMIDNGDGTSQKLVAEDFPDVRIIASHGNVGFGRANNILARFARSRYLLLLNPDMILFPGAIDALLDGAVAHPEASAWGGVTMNTDGQPDTGNAIPVPSLCEFASAALGLPSRSKLPPERLYKDREAQVLSGAFVMFSREAWDAVGGFDERYFLYCEEVDLFHRLAARGHRFWRIANARGEHLAGHGQGTSPMRTLYLATGRAEFMRAHWSIPKRIVGLGLLWIAAFERYVMGSLFGRWRPRLRARNEALRLLVRRPWLWMRGYDEKNGLLVQLKRLGGKIS